MVRSDVAIATRDGRCNGSWILPDASGGPWPAVIVYMDGIGMRPAIVEIGERIASRGYAVLLPDLFYRAGPYTPVDPAKLFADPEVRAAWHAKFVATTNQANLLSDTRAFLDFLSAQPTVKQGKVGVTGYCMGGGFALAATGHFPDRIAAAASFHGARLATDAPDSPHLLAPRIKARVYVAGAVEDASFTDEMKQRLEDALTAAHVEHTVITYEGARHGWVPRDTPVHNPAAAERHFEALFELFAATLG
jgi:carboxymethylenebutenolidase